MDRGVPPQRARTAARRRGRPDPAGRGRRRRDGLVSHWCTGARRLFGASKEDAVGRPAVDLLPGLRRAARRGRGRALRGVRARTTGSAPTWSPRSTGALSYPAAGARPARRAAARTGSTCCGGPTRWSAPGPSGCSSSPPTPARAARRRGRTATGGRRAHRARLRAAHRLPRRRGAGPPAPRDPAQHERRRERPDRRRRSSNWAIPSWSSATTTGCPSPPTGACPRRAERKARRSGRPPAAVRRRARAAPRPETRARTSNTPPSASAWSSSTRSAAASAPPSTCRRTIRRGQPAPSSRASPTSRAPICAQRSSPVRASPTGRPTSPPCGTGSRVEHNGRTGPLGRHRAGRRVHRLPRAHTVLPVHDHR